MARHEAPADPWASDNEGSCPGAGDTQLSNEEIRARLTKRKTRVSRKASVDRPPPDRSPPSRAERSGRAGAGAANQERSPRPNPLLSPSPTPTRGSQSPSRPNPLLAASRSPGDRIVCGKASPDPTDGCQSTTASTPSPTPRRWGKASRSPTPTRPAGLAEAAQPAPAPAAGAGKHKGRRQRSDAGEAGHRSCDDASPGSSADGLGSGDLRGGLRAATGDHRSRETISSRQGSSSTAHDSAFPPAAYLKSMFMNDDGTEASDTRRRSRHRDTKVADLHGGDAGKKPRRQKSRAAAASQGARAVEMPAAARSSGADAAAQRGARAAHPAAPTAKGPRTPSDRAGPQPQAVGRPRGPPSEPESEESPPKPAPPRPFSASTKTPIFGTPQGGQGPRAAEQPKACSVTDSALYNPNKAPSKLALSSSAGPVNPAFGSVAADTFGEKCQKAIAPNGGLAASPLVSVRLPRCADLRLVAASTSEAEERIEPGRTRVKIRDSAEETEEICKRNHLKWKDRNHHMNSRGYVVEEWDPGRKTVIVFDEKLAHEGHHKGKVKLPRECVTIILDEAREFDPVRASILRQAVLGSRSPGLLALARWYWPYALLAALLLPAAALGLPRRAAALAMLLPPMLFVLHLLRLRRRDRSLLAAVDGAALAHAMATLMPPEQGWGQIHGKYAAQLVRAMEVVSASGGLLLSATREPCPWSAPAAAAAAEAALAALWLAGGDAQVQVALAVLTVVALLVFGCGPWWVQPRAQVVDRRLDALEASLASLVDVIRPLSNARPAEGPGRRECSTPVRFVTQEPENQTLRGALRVRRRGGVCAVEVACPLGDFTVEVRDSVQHAIPDWLGKTAQGKPRMPPVSQQKGPLVGLLPRSWARALSGAAKGASGAYQDAVAAPSHSMRSASTASTARGSNLDTSEMTLNLAADMSAAMKVRGGEPLEVFRDADGGGPAVMPPKAGVDEPSLTLGVLQEKARIVAGPGFEGGHSTWRMCRRRATVEDRLGVLRTSAQWRSLTGKAAAERMPSLPDLEETASVNSDESPGGFSLGNVSERRSLTPTSRPASKKVLQLVLLFDSPGERDACLEEMRISGLCVA